VRELAFGPEQQFLRYLGYHTAAFVFEDEALAARLHGQFRMLSVPNRQVAVYPLHSGRVATFFAHRAPRPLRPDRAAAELRRVYGDLGWYIPNLLDAADIADDIYYDWMAQIEMPQWHSGRTVLIGDAAYAVSLLAGQGASLAVGGAYQLAEAVSDGGIDAGLARFGFELRPAILKHQAAGRRMADWIVPPSALHNWMRDAFLNVARVPLFSNLLGWFFAPSAKGLAGR
jgi:2-polyprenyl-6-methoxyphenol hydroxylase-like FAD-dependent oxidoreductase